MFKFSSAFTIGLLISSVSFGAEEKGDSFNKEAFDARMDRMEALLDKQNLIIE